MNELSEKDLEDLEAVKKSPANKIEHQNVVISIPTSNEIGLDENEIAASKIGIAPLSFVDAVLLQTENGTIYIKQGDTYEQVFFVQVARAKENQVRFPLLGK